jgi:hypothetical protein
LTVGGGVDVNLAVSTRFALSGGVRALWLDRDKSTLPLSAAAIQVPISFQYRF